MEKEKALTEPLRRATAPAVKRPPAAVLTETERPDLARRAAMAVASQGVSSAAGSASPLDGGSLPGRAGVMRSLQRTLGNGRVSRMMAPGARAEAERDRADSGPSVMRQCACDGADCAECQARRQSTGQADGARLPDQPPSSVAKVLKAGGGEPIAPATRAPMEQAFGADLRGVRFHTNADAARAAHDLNAEAFTVGQDIYFGRGRYRPEASDGKKLLAHELMHTVQQGEARPAVQRELRVSQPSDPEEREAEAVANRIAAGQTSAAAAATGTGPRVARQEATPASGTPATAATPAAPVDADAVSKAIDVIKDALGGWITTRGDSARVLAQFQGQSPAMVQAVLQGFKNSGLKNKSPDELVDYLFDELTAEDRRDLRKVLITAGVVGDLARIVARDVKKRLGGLYTSESDSHEIYAALTEFGGGPRLDEVLGQLEAQNGKDAQTMPERLFGPLDGVTAERLRQFFFQAGGTKAAGYVLTWTAVKVHGLLKGYVSHADSSAVVRYFDTTPEPYRPVVFSYLDTRTRETWGKSAEDALMEFLDQSDYEALQKMGALKLGPYDAKRGRGGLRKAVAAAEWAGVVAQWVVCGVLGTITGLLSAIWQIIKGVWDIGVAAWNLLWSLVYLISGGSAGSENWLAVKDFFRGLKALGEPGKLWDQYWDNLKLEFKTIEGPLADCRRAEFVVRQFMNAVINIVLVFVGGYGLAKAAVSAAAGTAEFAALAREVGALRALVQVGARAGGAVRKFVVATAEDVAKLVRALRNPIELLVRVGQRINALVIAARQEGVWASLRGHVGALTNGEREWWQRNKDRWAALAERQQGQHAELADEAGALADNLGENKVPDQPEATATALDDRAKGLDGQVSDLQGEMTGEPQPEGHGPVAKPAEPGPEPGAGAAATTEGDVPAGLAEFCAAGSLKCRRGIPAKVRAQVEEYPHPDRVPEPSGGLEVRGRADAEYAELREQGNTRNLRKIVLENPDTWPPEFRQKVEAAARLAKKEGRELDVLGDDWPRDSDGRAWEVHHRKPLDFGGDNSVANLIPIEKSIHADLTTWWRSVKRTLRTYFTDSEWERLIGGAADEVFDPASVPVSSR
jgi:5-methylcytosine-specific restriction endonuclease McrA